MSILPSTVASLAVAVISTSCIDDHAAIDSTVTTTEHRDTARVLPPNQKVRGKTRAEWESAFNVWINSVPFTQNPALDPSLPCDVGQSGPMFFTVSGITDCVMPEDKYLFLPIGGAGDTYPCADPDIAAAMGAPAPGQSVYNFLTADVRSLTSQFFDFSNFELRIDGKLVPVEPYHTTSTLFSFVADPSLAVPDFDPCISPGTTQVGVFDGWVMLVEPMSVGTHTVHKVNHVTGTDRTVTFHVVDRD